MAPPIPALDAFWIQFPALSVDVPTSITPCGAGLIVVPSGAQVRTWAWRLSRRQPKKGQYSAISRQRFVAVMLSPMMMFRSACKVKTAGELQSSGAPTMMSPACPPEIDAALRLHGHTRASERRNQGGRRRERSC